MDGGMTSGEAASFVAGLLLGLLAAGTACALVML